MSVSDIVSKKSIKAMSVSDIPFRTLKRFTMSVSDNIYIDIYHSLAAFRECTWRTISTLSEQDKTAREKAQQGGSGRASP